MQRLHHRTRRKKPAGRKVWYYVYRGSVFTLKVIQPCFQNVSIAAVGASDGGGAEAINSDEIGVRIVFLAYRLFIRMDAFLDTVVFDDFSISIFTYFD